VPTANPNTLQLVIQVEADNANNSIKSVNASLSSLESTAVSAARGASQGIDGLTASVARGAAAGTVLAHAFEKVVGWVKEYTLEAARLAARNETLAVVNQQLARANSYNGDAIERLVDRIKALGITTQASRDTVNKMIAAQLDLSKATDLARLAQDAAVVAGQNSSQALEGIIHGITTQQIEVLRTYGINVQFEQAFTRARQRLGRDLTDLERKNLALQRVLAEAPKIAGAYEASLGTVGKQITSLERFIEEAKAAIGQQFLPELRKLISGLTELAKWARENADAISLFAKAIGAAAVGLAIGQFITWVTGAKVAVDALTLAMARNPITLIAIGATIAGTAFYEMQRRSQELEEQLFAQNKTAAEAARILDLVSNQGKNLDDLQKMGFTVDQIRRAFVGAKAGAEGFLNLDAESFGVRLKVVNEQELREVRKRQAEELAKDIQKSQLQGVRASREFLLSAQESAVKGPAKALLEVQKEIDKLTTVVDERGVEHRFQMLTETRLNVERALQVKLRAVAKEESDDLLRQARDAYERRLEFETDLFQKRLDYQRQAAAGNLEHIEKVYGFEEQRAGIARDAQLRALEAGDAQTLRQKLGVEQRKMEIEVAYLQRVHEIKMRLFEFETDRILFDERLRMERLGFEAERVNARITELAGQREEIRRQMSEQTDAAITAARENATIRQTQMVRDQYRQIFDSLKQQAGGVFDALLTKSQSVFGAIGNALKTALLTAIKEVVTSRVAVLLTQLFTGARVSFAQGGVGGGALGRLGGVLGIGAVPVFGGVGRITTPPFNPNASIPGVTGSTRSGGFSPAGFAGFLPGLKEFFGIGDSVQLGPGVATTWQAATLVQRLSSVLHSPAAALGGGLLALAGLRRGGLSGLAMTTAGGALIGFKYGGPLGAAIGAGAGAVAGIVRLFVKGAQEKAREKIKAVYGVDISDKGVLRQVVDTAKQAFGGNLDVAIRSPQVRDLVELYALSTGQKPVGLPATLRPVSLAQSGGALFQQGAFSNGGPAFAGLPTIGLDRIGAGAIQNAAPIVIKLDGPATTALLRGEAVQAIAENPRVVQAAAVSATKANAGRRELLSLHLSPGTLTS
jgi:hypothetical protein